MFLTFFYMFITFSTFTTISYIPIEKRVPQNAQKAPPQSFVPAVGLLMRNYCFYLLALGTRLAILMVCAPDFVFSKNSVTSPTVRSALSMVSVPIILKITYHTFSWQNHFLHESTVREILFSYNLFIIHAVIRSFLGDVDIMRMTLLQGCSGDLHKSAGLLQGLDILCTAVAHTGTETAE